MLKNKLSSVDKIRLKKYYEIEKLVKELQHKALFPSSTMTLAQTAVGTMSKISEIVLREA